MPFRHVKLSKYLILFVLLSFNLAACKPNGSYIILVTATPESNALMGPVSSPAASPDSAQPDSTVPPIQPTSAPTPTFIPTPESTRVGITPVDEDIIYIVQPGDTLAIISQYFGVSVETIMQTNGMQNADFLAVGQSLTIPQSIQFSGPPFKIIPDSELVYGPGVGDFSVSAAIKVLPHSYLAAYTEELDGQIWTGPEIIERVALEQSLNPRLLLALLEYQSKWLSRSNLSGDAVLYPMGYKEQPARIYGLYRQVDWAGKLLQLGYYGWRLKGLSVSLLGDGSRVALDPTLNAGTAGVQLLLAQTRTYEEWLVAASHTGFFSTYVAMFGDPFLYTIDPLIPSNLTQPELTFPWAENETWYYTGGPHGGWGTGSAWAALDFVSRQETTGCEIDAAWARAVANGVIARSELGFVILDLDGDGDPGTGWTVFYLHVSSEGRQVTQGQRVKIGDPIGHPSCEGGFSTATHLHIARRYNGEWISADCTNCQATVVHPQLNFSGWLTYTYGNEYDGTLDKGSVSREACACRAYFNTMRGWE